MVIIDRFEGPYAVCECGDDLFVHIARKLIDTPALEGDVLILQGNRFVVDATATQQRRQRIQGLMKGLFS